MRHRRSVRVAGVLCGLALLTAACGDDKTTTPSDKTTTTKGVDTAGTLAGWKGTTPAPETTPETEAFNDKMLAIDPDLVDFNYGPEAHDAAIIIALATLAADSDGIKLADQIVNVTTDGEKCTTFKACKAIIDGGDTDVDYDGIAGPHTMSGNGEPKQGSYAVLSFGADNRIDDKATTFKGGTAPSTVDDIPLAKAEGTRKGNGVLKIGALLPETGSLAFLGPPEIAGVKVAVEEINAEGGVLGKPVESTFSDSGDTSTNIASQSVDRLVSEDVDAIIGAASSSVTLSVIDKVVGEGITMFSPANTSSTLSTYADKGLYFRVAPPDVIQGKVLSEVIAEDGVGSIYILNLDDSYGNGLAANLKESFEASGGEVIDSVAYDPQAQTYEAEVGEAKAADPDAIVVIGFEESSRIVAEMIKQGVGPDDLAVYGCDGNMGNATGEKFENPEG